MRPSIYNIKILFEVLTEVCSSKYTPSEIKDLCSAFADDAFLFTEYLDVYYSWEGSEELMVEISTIIRDVKSRISERVELWVKEQNFPKLSEGTPVKVISGFPCSSGVIGEDKFNYFKQGKYIVKTDSKNYIIPCEDIAVQN